MRLRTLVILPLCLAVTACATTATTKQRPQAQIEIQEAVGFTITEPVSVSEAVRVDYERAVMLLEQGRTSEGISILESVVERAPEVSGPRIDLGAARLWRCANPAHDAPLRVGGLDLLGLFGEVVDRHNGQHGAVGLDSYRMCLRRRTAPAGDHDLRENLTARTTDRPDGADDRGANANRCRRKPVVGVVGV